MAYPVEDFKGHSFGRVCPIERYHYNQTLGEFVITIGAGWLDSSGQISTHQSWIVYGSTSTDDCENACKIKSGCVGFTFVSTIERCDLKDIQQAVTLMSQPEAIISGILGNLFSMCIGMTRYDMTIIVSR